MSPQPAGHLFGDEHVRSYLETDGEVGYLWREDSTIAILTTTGRVTGEPHLHPLIFGRDGESVVFVASKGGAPAHPGWYRNLVKHPEAQVQILGDRFPVWARTAEGEERDRLWRLMNTIWPHYDEYQAKTDREIPVVVLDRI
ncbi:MAG TPA: nitroreductase family deazaflavin-dependent oxidoreductase [Gaiellaceae bacterium]|nr:nitroreductase family deazaflavin-dependent oxidoreductase [Gaiellaceae bacterium]